MHTARCVLVFAVFLPMVDVFAQEAGGPPIQPEIAEKLLRVKRIYVESFGDGDTSRASYAMVVNSLGKSNRFIITENKDKADAVLKGAAVERSSQELHSSSEATAVGNHRRGAAIRDSVTSTETIDRVALAVRLIHSDGDLIWATTQESLGAKYKGAGADVADKIVKQLLHDLEKLEKLIGTNKTQ